MDDAVPVREPDDGTYLSTFRQGKWACAKGHGRLKGILLKPNSPTTRYVATCCNSAMFLIYSRGFWVTDYRQRFADSLPPLGWRQKLKYRISDLPFTDDIPQFNGFAARLFWRILRARLGK